MEAYAVRVYWCVIILLVTQNVHNFANGCTTPKGETGDCILLIQCRQLFGLLKKRPVSPADILYLQQSTCDVHAGDPRVCCPKGGGGIPTSTTTTTTTTTTPPPVKTTRPPPVTPIKSPDNDITEHRNFHLIPNVTECGKSVLTDRITGGEDAGLGVYPWMALLGFAAGNDEPIQYACGGTLINSLYVLTAAHCVANLPYGYKLKTVRLGEYDQTTTIDCEKTGAGTTLCAPPVQDLDIDEVIPHEDYDRLKSKENDIALIRLKKRAALGPYVSPVCIPQGERLQRVTSDSKVFVSGWGRMTYDNPDSAPVLQVVALRLVAMDECNKFYAQKENFGEVLDEGRFCANGNNGEDSCKGDSGGPLMMPLRPKSLGGPIRIFQLGVVSLGPSKCGHAGQPALYTKISHFLTWIYDHIRR